MVDLNAPLIPPTRLDLLQRIMDLEALVARLCEDSHGYNTSRGGNDMRSDPWLQEDRVKERAIEAEEERKRLNEAELEKE